LNSQYHLIFDQEIKDNFLLDSKEIYVPCVFQIWEFKDSKREAIVFKNKSHLFSFCNIYEADFAVRRVGGNTGKIFEVDQSLSKQSNYFIKSNIDIVKLKNAINLIDFSFANNTSGVKSLSKSELISEVEKRIKLD
jgi:hypothetical protein